MSLIELKSMGVTDCKWWPQQPYICAIKISRTLFDLMSDIFMCTDRAVSYVQKSMWQCPLNLGRNNLWNTMNGQRVKTKEYTSCSLGPRDIEIYIGDIW